MTAAAWALHPPTTRLSRWGPRGAGIRHALCGDDRCRPELADRSDPARRDQQPRHHRAADGTGRATPQPAGVGCARLCSPRRVDDETGLVELFDISRAIAPAMTAYVVTTSARRPGSPSTPRSIIEQAVAVERAVGVEQLFVIGVEAGTPQHRPGSNRRARGRHANDGIRLHARHEQQ